MVNWRLALNGVSLQPPKGELHFPPFERRLVLNFKRWAGNTSLLVGLLISKML